MAMTKGEILATLHSLRSLMDGRFANDTSAFFVGERHQDDSTGHCAVCAIIVQKYLGGDFVSTTVRGVSHWFNRVYVPTAFGPVAFDVDVTGDQFGFRRVTIADAGCLYAGGRIRRSDELNDETLSRTATFAKRAGL